MMFLAQVEQNLFNAPSNTSSLFVKLALGAVVGLVILFAMMNAPTRARKLIVGLFTFVAGLVYVLSFLWPKPIPAREEGDIPQNLIESGSFAIDDLVNLFGDITNVLTAFLLGLGIYSLLRVHLVKFTKQQKDWFFSLVLLISLFTMAIVGFVDWNQSTFGENRDQLIDRANWGWAQYTRDLLFDGLLQEMDAALFSIIAFYILSAAYRAFRVRSIEATILLCTALIVMVSLMGAIEFQWGQLIDGRTGDDPGSFLNNLKLTSIRSWLGNSVETPSLRAIQFGIGIGALAMGLRLWLSLERGGARS